MSVFLLSPPPSLSLSFLPHRSTTTTTTITSCSSVQTLSQPLTSSISSIPDTSSSSSPCSLNCPHFESCSGCTHDQNLHRPIVLQEATTFFKKLGVSDFTFDTCRL
ncbi:hypothetical protein Tco_0030445, partial [Tanacetum coccineum]